MSRKLIVNDGRRERELLLVDKIVVGRDPLCDITDGDALLSRRHAEFAVAGDVVTVRDLGSRNGIFLNGAKTAEAVLRSGDAIQVGHLQLHFLEDGTPIAAAPEMADGEATAVIPAASRSGAAPPPASGVQPVSGSSLNAPPPAVAAPPIAREDESDLTSLVPPPVLSEMLRPGTGSRPGVAAPPAADPAKPHPDLAPDENDQTRVVAPPELRAAIHMAMAHPAPSPAQAAAQLFGGAPADSGVAAPSTPAPAPVAAPQPAAAPAASAPAPVAVPALPSQSAWPAFVQARVGMAAGIVAVCALLFPALNLGTALSALLTIAVAGAAAFVVASMIVEETNRDVRALALDVGKAAEGTLESIPDPMGTAGSKDLVNALNGLAGRVRAADTHRR